jgi:putative pyruvate formate lyase activating enzyme
VFCQNHDISQGLHTGENTRDELLTPAELAALMRAMAARGVHNVNLVSPSHVAPQLVEALGLAREQGLELPVVWNSGGYDDVEMLQLLDGLVEIYMPDAKYWDAAVAEQLSGIADYPAVLRAALREMHRQVGDLALDEKGVATAGLLVRHLVLPEGLAGSEGVLRFLAEEISVRTYVNIMGQYHPSFRSHVEPRLGRAPSAAEMGEAFDLAARFGLERLDERPHRRWWL